MLTRKSVILAEAEVTYGTDPTPSTSLHGVLTTVPTWAVDAEEITRDYARDTLSPIGHTIGAKKQTLEFETELKGANDNADPDKLTHLDPLLLACGLVQYGSVLRLPVSSITGTFTEGEPVTGGTSAATGVVVRLASSTRLHLRTVTGTFSAAETITGGTSAATATVGSTPMADATMEYRPTSDPDSMGSVTVYWYADAVLHKLLGARGTVSADFPVGNLPKLKFKLTGLWADPADTTHPSSVTYEEHMPPRVVSSGLTVGSYTPVGVNTVSADFGMQVTDAKDVNASEGLYKIHITGRNPSGNIDPEVAALSSFNSFSIWKAGTKQALGLLIGSDLGNKVGLYMPEIQIGKLGYSDRAGTRIYSLPFTPTGDDDEIALQLG